VTAPGTIAVLGAGPVGRTLAAGWAGAGYHVVLGSRAPGSDRIRAVVAELGVTASAAEHAEAARYADIAVIAVPGDQVPALIGELGDALADRVTIDTTNILTPGAPILHHADALRAAGARVYRAFNLVGVEQMDRPLFGSIRADMCYAGPIPLTGSGCTNSSRRWVSARSGWAMTPPRSR